MVEIKPETGTDIVESAIRAWKRNHHDTGEITPSGRSSVLRSAVSASTSRELPRLSNLFPAYHRIALAAFILAALLAVALVISLGDDPVPTAITAEKVGNQVVFSIANGGKVHSVSKSNSPHTFDPGNSVRIHDGSYRDSMVDNGDLVFYRID